MIALSSVIKRLRIAHLILGQASPPCLWTRHAAQAPFSGVYTCQRGRGRSGVRQETSNPTFTLKIGFQKLPLGVLFLEN